MPTLTASYSGLVNGDTAASLTTSPTLSSTATAASNVGSYSIAPSGAVDSNYTISYVNGSLGVTPAPLTITADNQSKVYGAGLPTLTASYSGLVNGDTAASLATSPTLSSTATAASNVGSYSIAPSGAVDSNYTISYVNGSLAVTSAPLTITADNQSKVYGAGLPTLTASYSGLVNGDTAASLATSPTLSSTATAASNVGSYSIAPSGAVDSNYTISYVNGSLGVTPAPLTITADNQSKVYGAGLPTLTASYSGFVNNQTPASLTTVPTLSTTATASSNVGNYSIVPSGAVDSNYTITFVNGSLAVTSAPLTITADNQSKVYGAGMPTLTASYSGLVNGDTAASLATSPTLSSTATAASNVGSYAIAPSGAVDSNYTISYVNGALAVTPADLTITASNASKTYGQALPTFSAGYTGLVNGDTAASLTTPPSVSTTATAASNVGSYALVPAGAVDSNYTITYANGALTVNPADLTITAGNASKIYGQPIPTLSASYSGFVNGDTAASLTTLPAISTAAIAGSNVGGYAIVPAGAIDSNYAITYVNGSLTVNPATLTVGGTSVANKVYDGTTAATLSGGTLSGIIGSDAVTLTQAGAFASANAGTGVAVNAADTLSGAAAGNYTVTQPTGLSANITPASLTVSGTSVANKVYDSSTAALLYGGTLSGVIGSDSVGLTQTGAFTSANAGTGIAVNASDTLTGAGAGNYVLTQPTGLSGNITPASLTVNGTSVANKVYDGTTTASLSGGTLSGLVGSDSVTLTQSGAFASANAGNGVAVNAADSLSGVSASNYTLTEPTGLTANITPATLTYVALPNTTTVGKPASGTVRDVERVHNGRYPREFDFGLGSLDGECDDCERTRFLRHRWQRTHFRKLRFYASCG